MVCMSEHGYGSRGQSKKRGLAFAAGVIFGMSLLLSGCGMKENTEILQTESPGAASDVQPAVMPDSEAGAFIEDTGITEVGTENGTETALTETEEALVVADHTKGRNSSEISLVREESRTVSQTENQEEGQTENQSGNQEEGQTENESDPEVSGPALKVLNELLKGRIAQGEKWSLAYEDLTDGTQYGYQSGEKMQSASVIKLFIMGAVYRYMCYPEDDEDIINFSESYDGELRDTIEKMITVSDNDAANLLVAALGGGDFTEGAKKVEKFAKQCGCTSVHLGRQFLEEQPSDDNYVSAADCRRFLSDLYHNKVIGEEASGKMLDILKGQTLKNKIPAGLPDGFTSANKTGEMPDGYGLGCIENDAAIVFPPEGSGEGYILVVLSNELDGKNEEAQSTISSVSSEVAQWYLENRS